MPRTQTVTERGLEPHWKIRVVFPGSVLHFAGSTEPRQIEDWPGWFWTPINGPAYGDTLGYIDWDAVIAVSWRWAP